MKKLILVLLALALSITTVFAESEEWTSKTYDFTKIKTITVILLYPNNTISQVSRRNIPELTKKKLTVKNIRLLSQPDIFNIMQKNGFDFTVDNEKGFYDTQLKTINDYSDATLFISIAGYGMSSEYVPGQTISYQNNTVSTVTNANGSLAGQISTPTTQQINIPGGNRPVAFAYVEMNLFDNKTQQPIFSRKDFRDKVNGTAFDNTSPKDLYARILGTLSDKLNDMIKK